MMTERLILLSLHAVTAVLGLGPIVALALLASRRTPPEIAKALVFFSRLIQWALLVMLATGLWLSLLSGWAVLRQPWMHVSLTLYLVAGALLGLNGPKLRRAVADSTAGDLSRVRRFALISCALVGGIVVLMVVKPG